VTGCINQVALDDAKYLYVLVDHYMKQQQGLQVYHQSLVDPSTLHDEVDAVLKYLLLCPITTSWDHGGS
jgi:hypothetical protein